MSKISQYKMEVPLKNIDRKSKFGWELRLESQIRKQNIKIYSDAAEKARQPERKIKLDETNQ